MIIEEKHWVYGRGLQLAFLHAKAREDLLYVLMSVYRDRSVRMKGKLDSEERTRSFQIVKSEFCFQCPLDTLDLIIGCCRNQKIVDVDADNTISLVGDKVVRLGHGEAMGCQDAVNTSVPDPRGLLKAV